MDIDSPTRARSFYVGLVVNPLRSSSDRDLPCALCLFSRHLLLSVCASDAQGWVFELPGPLPGPQRQVDSTIERRQIRCALPGSISDQKLMFEQKRLCGDGACAAGAEQLRDGDQQVDG
jgi:hypothetical protein